MGTLVFVKSLPKKVMVKCLTTLGIRFAGLKETLSLSLNIFQLSFLRWKRGQYQDQPQTALTFA